MYDELTRQKRSHIQLILEKNLILIIMKILVVDDERDVRALFEQRFRKEIRDGEMSFAFAYSGEEALGYLNALDHEAVLILSDINMPGMSGLDLLKHIKTHFEKPPP